MKKKSTLFHFISFHFVYCRPLYTKSWCFVVVIHHSWSIYLFYHLSFYQYFFLFMLWLGRPNESSKLKYWLRHLQKLALNFCLSETAFWGPIDKPKHFLNSFPCLGLSRGTLKSTFRRVDFACWKRRKVNHIALSAFVSTDNQYREVTFLVRFVHRASTGYYRHAISGDSTAL